MSAAKQPTILIVEDDEFMRTTLRHYVQTASPGCTVLEAANGHAAMQICREFQPRLVLMDVGLPDANGIELTVRIKATMPDTQVIVISYNNSQAQQEHALSSGAIGYIVKENIYTEFLPLASQVLPRGSAQKMDNGKE